MSLCVLAHCGSMLRDQRNIYKASWQYSGIYFNHGLCNAAQLEGNVSNDRRSARIALRVLAKRSDHSVTVFDHSAFTQTVNKYQTKKEKSVKEE